MTQKVRIVTTSWDDGDPRDLRVAELLRARGLSGTFYVLPRGYNGKRRLDRVELESLAAGGLEVGAHGLTHATLTDLRPEEITREVRICREELEDILRKEVPMFCYPRGRFNARVVQCVKKAGYVGARTTEMLAHGLNFNPFEMPTTLQVYPHKRLGYLMQLARRARVRQLCEWSTQFGGLSSWFDLGKRLFDFVLREGGIWHLYGHSSEIDDLGLWPKLEELLDYVCRRAGVIYLSNGNVLSVLKARMHTELQEALAARR